MRNFFQPAEAPYWLTAVLTSIRGALSDIWPTALKLKDHTTAALPPAADWKQGLVYDSTLPAIKFSDGTNWVRLQNQDADLDAIAALTTTGFLSRTGAGTYATRTLTAPAAGFTITNPAGIAGEPTFVLANDLAALEALSGTNTIYYRSGADTWSAVTIGSGLSFAAGTLSVTITQYTDELAQDAVGTILTDTATIDFTYNDVANTIAADVKDGSIAYAKMQDVSATDKLLGRSTAGAGDVEEITCTAAGRALLDDADNTAQRTTLGLGTAAVKNTGTSGNTVPLLDGTNTWSGVQTISANGVPFVNNSANSNNYKYENKNAGATVSYWGANSTYGLLVADSAVTERLAVSIGATPAILLNATQVLTTRRTGWGAPTGTATRTTFATSTVTLEQLAERVKALIDDSTTHGLIGT